LKVPTYNLGEFVFTIDIIDVAPLKPNYGVIGKGPGEQATVVATGVVIHPEIADTIPRDTQVSPLTSIGDEHTYHVVVRGYTIEEFKAIAVAYANKDFTNAKRLSDELSPNNTPKR
jgi:hypothetical protein